jgi:glycosyltransferase involved in cell wall biosynthesis
MAPVAYDVAFYAPLVAPILRQGLEGTAPGGSELQTMLIARGLAARGHRVAVVTVDDGQGGPDRFGDVDVVRHPPLHGSRMLVPGAGTARYVARLHSILRRVPTPVWVQRAAGPITGLVALSARLGGRRFVYSSASVFDFDYARIEPRRPNRALFGLGVRLASRVVVQTDEQLELCAQRFRRDGVVVRSIAQPAAPAPRPGDAFVWVGRLASYKHPEHVLALAAAVPEARFRIVGGPDANDGGALARRVGAEAEALPNVELLGHLPRTGVFAEIERAVAVLNTTELEGMPNVFLEAWARGVPALSLDHDPDGVVARHRLGLFAGGDHRRFADGARELWRDRNAAADLAARCRAYVDTFHAEGVALDGWERALGLAARGSRG